MKKERERERKDERLKSPPIYFSRKLIIINNKSVCQYILNTGLYDKPRRRKLFLCDSKNVTLRERQEFSLERHKSSPTLYAELCCAAAHPLYAHKRSGIVTSKANTARGWILPAIFLALPWVRTMLLHKFGMSNGVRTFRRSLSIHSDIYLVHQYDIH